MRSYNVSSLVRTNMYISNFKVQYSPDYPSLLLTVTFVSHSNERARRIATNISIDFGKRRE